MPASASVAGGAAGRDDLDPELDQPARELDDPGLVGDRQQRPRDLDLARGDRWPNSDAGSVPCSIAGSTLPLDEHAPRVGRIEPDRAAGDQPDRLGQQLVLDRVQALEHLRRRRAASGSSIARWRITGPVSTPSSTKCTVTPNTLTP